MHSFFNRSLLGFRQTRRFACLGKASPGLIAMAMETTTFTSRSEFQSKCPLRLWPRWLDSTHTDTVSRYPSSLLPASSSTQQFCCPLSSFLGQVFSSRSQFCPAYISHLNSGSSRLASLCCGSVNYTGAKILMCAGQNAVALSMGCALLLRLGSQFQLLCLL